MLGKFIRKFDTRGQTLLEILIALGVGVAVLSGIVVLVFTSLSGAQFSKNQNLATQYGQEGMEVIRKLRDESWSNFQAYSGKYCLSKEKVLSQLIEPSCPSSLGGVFAREVDFDDWNVDKTKVKVTVEVSWTDSKGKHQSKLISYFTKWSS